MPDFTLNEEHEALRASVRDFADDVVAPVIGEYYEDHTFPYDIVRADGQDGPVRPAVPGGGRRHGRRLLRAVPRPRGAGPGRLQCRDHAGGRDLARRDADLPLRHRRAEGDVAAAAGHRRGARARSA